MKAALDGCAHCAGIYYVDTGVRAVIDTGEDNVRACRHQLRDSQFHTVGRGAATREPLYAVFAVVLDSVNRLFYSEGTRLCRAWPVRSYYRYAAVFLGE